MQLVRRIRHLLQELFNFAAVHEFSWPPICHSHQDEAVDLDRVSDDYKRIHIRHYLNAGKVVVQAVLIEITFFD